MKQSFNVKHVTEDCINWIKQWFIWESGNAEGVVVCISGGKDSTIVAKLCVEALGKDRVFGLLLPNGEQSDIDDSIEVCKILGINYRIVNIEKTYNAMVEALNFSGMNNGDKFVVTPHTATNIPPRIRMAVAYAIAQEMHYRVAGSGNFSERFIGYCTKHADCNGWDFNPIGRFTYTEVLQIGDYLGLPYSLVHKTPSDGLCGKTDEDNFGFTYEELDKVIEGEKLKNKEHEKKIMDMHKASYHKWIDMPVFPYGEI